MFESTATSRRLCLGALGQFGPDVGAKVGAPNRAGGLAFDLDCEARRNRTPSRKPLIYGLWSHTEFSCQLSLTARKRLDE